MQIAVLVQAEGGAKDGQLVSDCLLMSLGMCGLVALTYFSQVLLYSRCCFYIIYAEALCRGYVPGASWTVSTVFCRVT